MYKLLKIIDEIVEKFAIYSVVIAIFSMLFFSILGIVLRWFNISFLWLDPFVRHVVFFSAFMGGVIATGRGSHICIDILQKQLELRGFKLASSIALQVVNLVSFLTLAWLVYTSFTFVEVELKYGKPVFWGIGSGYLVAIIPVGFALLSYRFFFLFVSSFFSDKVKKAHFVGDV